MLKDLIDMNRDKFGSYEKLVIKLNISPSAISEWKAKRRDPTEIQIMQMANFIGYNPLQVLCVVMKRINKNNS